MSKGILRIYYGDGYGKSSAALGTAVSEAGRGRRVMVVSFLREKDISKIQMLTRFEPEMKFFRFEKSDSSFEKGFLREAFILKSVLSGKFCALIKEKKSCIIFLKVKEKLKI